MAVNIEAQYAAQRIDFATLEQIYIPRTLEVGWIHSIQKEGGHGEDFRLFVIGHKLKHWQRTRTIPSEKKVVHAWGNTDAISREPFIVIAESEPDPRLHRENFENHAALLTFADKHVRQEEHNDFRAFVYGCRVTDIRLRAESQAQTLINRWKDRTPAEHTHYISRGRQFYERHMVQFPHLRPAGCPGDHLYVKDPTPEATMSDIAFVNLHDARPTNEPKKPAGSRWVFERTLMQVPEATFGDYQTQRIVHLFALVSADHLILKRMVVKIIGSLTTRQVEKCLNREYDNAHKKLSNISCAHILKAYGSAIRRRASAPQLGYIFMEYAEHGDLGDYLAKHALENPGKQLAEPFLWLVFRAMVEAVFVMALGRRVPKHLPLDSYGKGLNLEPVEGWKPIINPDIKTYNIVLAAPQPDYYPAYPTPKMIDFGLCFDDGYFDDPKRKELGVGTVGYGPPEHDSKNFPDYRNAPVDIASEIFNVGLTMLNMMEPWVSRGMTSTEQSQLGFEHHGNYSYSYSSRLEELVFRCLEFPRRKRPSLTEVLYFTRVGLREWEAAYGSVNKAKENLLGFARVEVDGEEEFCVGRVAPRRWKGMRERRERVTGQACGLMRKAEEAGFVGNEREARRLRFGLSRGSP